MNHSKPVVRKNADSAFGYDCLECRDNLNFNDFHFKRTKNEKYYHCENCKFEKVFL